MKIYFLLILPIFFTSAYSRQNLPNTNFQKLNSDLTQIAAEVRFNNSFDPRNREIVYRDFEKKFYVEKSDMRDKTKIDSLFGLAKYYLVDAIKGGYNRIVITIAGGKGMFARFREQSFRCDLLYEQLTGKKLYSQ